MILLMKTSTSEQLYNEQVSLEEKKTKNNHQRTYLGWVDDALLHHIHILIVHSIIADL